ncbi:hypothetical protein GJB61_04105 [Paenibacillus sp. LC-T2]|uniref:CueP family metal-binding protein n=2 Tax=Paenibacillus monticola TaxID=2666075 RepID=A0A7X2H281_9BACL|nr:hypothetical protein [Paenibacillus monticola]
MRRKIMLATGLVVIVLAGIYMFVGSSEKKESTEIETQSMKQMVHDFSVRNTVAESASITSKQLTVTDDDPTKSVTYDLPKDEFFLSIAPYVEKTHPCATHSLTGCQGEMVEEDFNVSIVDLDGNSIMDKTLMKSQPNGFIDLWLPRDKTYRITIEHDGKIAESEVSTFESDDTCLTTMQLH